MVIVLHRRSSGDCSSRSSLRWAQSGALRDRGMMCCFGASPERHCRHADGGGDDRKPLDLGAAMIAVGLAWFIVRRGDDTIYRSQLKNGLMHPLNDC